MNALALRRRDSRPRNNSTSGQLGLWVADNYNPTHTPSPSTWNTPVWNAPTYTGSPAPPQQGNTVHYFNTIANLVSQTLSGWSRNPTNQVTSQGGVIANPGVLVAQSQAQAAQNYGPPRNYGSETSGGNSGILEAASGGIMGFISAYPIPIALGVLGVFLLMREPPRRR
jgi:hypothetical protein